MGKLFGALCLLTLAIVSCDPLGDSRFWIANPTRDSLYYFEAYDRFPLPKENPFRSYDEHGFYPYEQRNFKLGTGKWDEVINMSSPGSRSMLFYTFDKRTVEAMPWSVIRKRKLYRVYKLTLDELNRRNWRISLTDKDLLLQE